jgi:predicted ArsR family transcriptional regulator
MSSEAPWADLVVLAERERDLVRESRWEDLPAVSAERLRVAATLGTPPAAARPHLERLVELQREIHAGLSAGRAFTLQKLNKLDRGATALRGYNAGGYNRPASSINSRA